MKFVAMTTVAIAFVLTAGCAAVAETASDAKEAMSAKMSKEMSAADTITAAKARFEEASAKGCAWRDTSKMIKSAEEILAEGNEEKAKSVAGRALRQSEYGMKQCDAEGERLAS